MVRDSSRGVGREEDSKRRARIGRGVTTTRNTATSTRSHTRASEESNAKKQTHAVLDVRRRTKTKRTRTREKMLGPMMPTMGAMMRAASDVDSMFEHVMRDVGEGNFNFVRDGRAMRAMRGAIGRAKVEETKRGFLISAHAPGLAAKDVHVHVTTDARGNAKLCVSAGERSMTELGLPTKYIDMSVTPKASCIDGILRIAVLKKTSEAVRVPINATARAAIAEGEEDMETDDDGDESTITLSVPGFGERDITVTLHKPEDMLVVRGDSKTFGTFAKTFKNLPTDLEVKHIDVTVRHGLLNIKMADPHAIIPMDIIVSSVNSVVEEDSTKENVTLVRRSVPGVSADKVTCRLAADRMLHINITTSHGRAVFQQSLPRNIDFHSIRASCADGVLTVSADRDESANKSHTVQVEVSGDHPAALIEPATETNPTAALPESDEQQPVVEEPEYDGKVEDVEDVPM